MPNIFNEFGRDTVGAIIETVIVGPTLVPSTVRALITEVGGTVANPGANGTIRLQISNDDFVVNIWTIDQLEMPLAGTLLKTFDSVLELPTGLKFRVTYIQTGASPISVTVTGQTQAINGSPTAPNIKETWLNGVGTTLP